MPEFIKLLNFSNPYFLSGIAIPVIILGISYLRNFISLNRYCDKHLLPWAIAKDKESLPNKILHGKMLPIISWVLFCIAIAGPRINIDERSSVTQKSYDSATVIVLDVSRSMLAEDIYPNRISKAKLLIDTILATSTQRLFSLVVYANNAHTVIPLTYDNNVIRNVIKSIHPNMLPVEGSNVESGLSLATTLLKQPNIKNRSILLFSDGDFNPIKKSSASVLNEKIKINVFGIGTNEGQAIPLKNGGWLSYNNRPVISRLNKAKLKKIAADYKGEYHTIQDNLNNASIKLTALSGETSSIKNSTNTIVIWKQVYNWFLIPAIFLYLLSTVSINNPFTRLHIKLINIKPGNNAIVPSIGLLFILSTIPSSSEAKQSSLEQANTAYFNKNYIKSEALYKKSRGYDAIFGRANSLYKQKNYLKAIHFYTQAILITNTNENRARALYNLANSYYLIGDYTQAINLYRDTLKYKPEFDKAKINLQYAIALDLKVKRALALRKGKKSSSPRTGSGPRSSSVEQGVDVGTSKVTLGESDDKFTFYNLPLNDKLTNQLINRGIKYSRISSTKIDKLTSNKDWNFEYTTLDMVELLVKQEKIDNFNLWKRLFEIEEGFPAPVEEPHSKPGVNPW